MAVRLLFRPLPANLRRLKDSDLFSFHHPADQCSCGNPYSKGRRNSQYKVSLEALSCIVQEFLGGITTLLCRTPSYSHAIVDRVGYRTGCARSLAS
jgi:hypothetical protein